MNKEKTAKMRNAKGGALVSSSTRRELIGGDGSRDRVISIVDAGKCLSNEFIKNGNKNE